MLDHPYRPEAQGDRYRATWQVSNRRACRALPVYRSTHHYRSRRAGQAHLIERIRETAATACASYRRIHVLLRREGWRVNPKRVYRMYRDGLAVAHQDTQAQGQGKAARGSAIGDATVPDLGHGLRP